MATGPKRRWIIFQHHGHHGLGSLEDTPHRDGGPFIFGRHRLDSELQAYWADPSQVVSELQQHSVRVERLVPSLRGAALPHFAESEKTSGLLKSYDRKAA